MSVSDTVHTFVFRAGVEAASRGMRELRQELVRLEVRRPREISARIASIPFSSTTRAGALYRSYLFGYPKFEKYIHLNERVFFRVVY